MYCKRVCILIFMFCLGLNLIYSQQSQIVGQVMDEESKELLLGVKVVLDSTGGALTDENGNFNLPCSKGMHTLKFVYEGYEPHKMTLNIMEGETRQVSVSISLIEVADLDIVVISGSRYEKKLAEETVSIDVVKPYLIQNNNATDLADVSRKVPGVSIIDGQANIRGGSGFTYGAGSRVQLLVDDLPMLTADLSEIRWNFVPLENIEQVEVIKGASSALYGSSAMNGVIHVRTGWAYDKPKTQLMVYQGVWDNPSDPELRWWGRNEQPYQTGMMFSHRQKFKNLDVVAGAHYHQSKNYLMFGDNMRGRANVKTRYQSEKIPGLSFGLNVNTMWEKFGRFFLWAGDGDSSYVPLEPEQRERYLLLAVDPHLKYISGKGGIHSLRGRYYYVRNYLYEDENMYSRNFYVEYQYMKEFRKGYRITTGVVSNSSSAYTNLLGYTNFLSQFGAAYAQAEKKFFKRLTVVAGVRYEINSVIDTFEHSDPTVRIGSSFQAGKATFLRGSWGQSYRFPSLVERYIDASFAGLVVFANPDLVAEKGWNAEFGIKQGAKFGKWQGFLDLALFLTQYENMTEFVLTAKDNNLGFQMQNLTQARIMGLEISGMGEGKIGPMQLRAFGGYTFVYPGDLQNDPTQQKMRVYLDRVLESLSSVDSIQNSLLRYRNRHQVRTDIELGWEKVMVGVNLNYYSFMDKIDGLISLFPGVKNFRLAHNKGNFFFDARVGFQATEKSTFTLIVKNAANAVYSLRPASLEAPRSFTIQYKYTF